MDSDRTRASLIQVIQLVSRVVVLVVFGIFFQSGMSMLTARLPRSIYFESSFTIALAAQSGLALAIGLLALLFVIWLASPFGRGRLAWGGVDSIGGLRWPIFAVAMALAWAYAGYPYNHYYGQSHVVDRWLIIVLLFGLLRSPWLIPLFVFEVLASRAQFNHPISSIVPIGDELPIRVLGIVFGCALWNGWVDGLRLVGSRSASALTESRLRAVRIPSHMLVFAVLCIMGFYYGVAGVSKLRIGEHVFDWLRFSHMENLFVASHVNGWFNFLEPDQVLTLAEVIRVLHLPLAAMSLVFELSMIFILVRSRATRLILLAIVLMHVGILITSGIVFWKWFVFDFTLLVWLWMRRSDPEVARMYSASNAIVSLVVIGGLIGVFGLNQFSWWNTKWTMLYEIEVLDEMGQVHRVNHADFKPYTLFDLYKPADRPRHTYVYGMTINRKMMDFFEASDPARLEAFARAAPTPGDAKEPAIRERAFNDFMRRYFANRNANPGSRVPPFFFVSPALHNRSLSGPDLYRDEHRVVEARLRFIEIYYSGSELKRMRDEIVYRVEIPDSVLPPAEPPNRLQ